jgi:hypothetical protein
MKTLLLLAAIAIALSSCTKSNNDPKPVQKVTYTVDCDYCLVYIEDAVWNRDNAATTDRPDATSQHFNVDGHWTYTWENTHPINYGSIHIIGSSYGGSQKVHASIKAGGMQTKTIDTILDADHSEAYFELILTK